MNKNYLNIIGIVLVVILMNSFFIVTEKDKAIKIEFGKPVGGPITESGLNFKIPLIQTIIKFDKRVLEWDGIANDGIFSRLVTIGNENPVGKYYATFFLNDWGGLFKSKTDSLIVYD